MKLLVLLTLLLTLDACQNPGRFQGPANWATDETPNEVASEVSKLSRISKRQRTTYGTGDIGGAVR
jgi:hypothetical protein